MTGMDTGSLYVQGEALFNKRKTSYNTHEGTSAKLSWNSVDIPVVIGYKLFNTKDFDVRAFAVAIYSYAFKNNLSTSGKSCFS